MKCGFKKMITKFNTTLNLLALFAVLSLVELPILHNLHHHGPETISEIHHSSSRPHYSAKEFHVDNLGKVCPLCSIGGVYDQTALSSDDFSLLNDQRIMNSLVPAFCSSTKYFHAKQRAPPCC